jgi:ABC-type glycerol-3-phosphate transport system permease component
MATISASPRVSNYRIGRLITRILVNLFLIVMALLFVVPFVWMISAAFKPISELFVTPLMIFPQRFTVENFQALFSATTTSAQGASNIFPRWYLNSIFVAGITTLLACFFSSLAGFAFAKYNFRGKSVLMAIVLGSMLVPFVVVAIPLFILMANLKWLNTFLALIVPFMAPAFGIFMMTQYLQSLPDELIDAARIDGSSDFGIYWRIVIPLIRPALGALAIFLFLQAWNSYFWPLLVMNTPTNYTLPMGLGSIRGENFKMENMGRVLAGSALVSAPMVLVFLSLQRQFISGLTMGAVKE